MPWKLALAALAACFALSACDRTADSPEPAAATPEDAAQDELLPFRARISFEHPAGLPEGATLNIYVVESDFETGTQRAIAEKALPASEGSPASVLIEVPRSELSPQMGYDMLAVITGPEGRVLMNAIARRAPTPALALHHDTVYRIDLLPTASPAAPEEIYRLPGDLAFLCGEIEAEVSQADDGTLRITTPEREFLLPPATAGSGGRFSDGSREFWITAELNAFLMIPGETPRNCTLREDSAAE